MISMTKAQIAIRDSWDFWLSQHDCSVPDTIEVAVRDAFAAWLDEHTDEIVAAIAKRTA